MIRVFLSSSMAFVMASNVLIVPFFVPVHVKNQHGEISIAVVSMSRTRVTLLAFATMALPSVGC